jgi:M6 family metalloprotease-like protein
MVFRAKREMRRRAWLGALVVSLFAIVLAVPPADAGPYPNPPPSFARTRGLYNPVNAAKSRPVLVIYAQYNDIAAPANQDAAFIARRYFGTGFPNALDYFNQNSFGKLSFTRAAESQGTTNDGVVTVNVGNSTTFRNQSADDQDRQQLQAADQYVNFASFDANNDGKVAQDELAVVSYVVAGAGATGCGQTNGTSALTLDGKNLGELRLAGSVTDANLLTQFHELAHDILGTPDIWNLPVYGFDLHGTTCFGDGANGTRYFNLGAWQKMNLGWINPTVVTKDGFYDVPRADTNPTAFILYDPDKGTNDYFMVENRESAAATYDAGISDSGLVIWLADNSAPVDSNNVNNPPIQVVRPPSSTTANTEAWDSGDAATPARTMTSTWRDGTPAKVAVRAIPGAADSMRVYFDVRGPGILVDPSGGVTFVTMGQANPVSFPVMNTGETTDTFRFTLEGLPAGWSASSPTQSLAAGANGNATVQLTVPPDTPVGDYTLQAVGTSTTDSTVTSRAPITVRVQKRATTIVYNGASTADYSDPAAVSAVLTDTATGQPIAGRAVHFELGTQSADATTNASGVAAASIVLTQPAGAGVVTASFLGDGTYLSNSDTDAFTITKETLSFLYTGSTLAALGTTPTLTSVATEEADGSPGDLSLAGAVFHLAPALTTVPFAYPAAVTAGGASTVSATGLPVDVWTITISVPASNAYWEGSSSAPAELVLYDPGAQVTGSGRGIDRAFSRASLTLESRYDSQGPKGNATLAFSGGSFTGRNPAWIVQVGSQAVLEFPGQLNGTPASLRVRVRDGGEPASGQDAFNATVRAPNGASLYDSGPVAVTAGNLQVHP